MSKKSQQVLPDETWEQIKPHRSPLRRMAIIVASIVLLAGMLALADYVGLVTPRLHGTPVAVDASRGDTVQLTLRVTNQRHIPLTTSYDGFFGTDQESGEAEGGAAMRDVDNDSVKNRLPGNHTAEVRLSIERKCPRAQGIPSVIVLAYTPVTGTYTTIALDDVSADKVPGLSGNSDWRLALKDVLCKGRK